MTTLTGTINVNAGVSGTIAMATPLTSGNYTWTGEHLWQPLADDTDILTVKTSDGVTTVFQVDTTNANVTIAGMTVDGGSF